MERQQNTWSHRNGVNDLTEDRVLETEEILDDIDELEDYIERLSMSNDISYDEDLHKTVIQMYSRLIKKIKDSHLSHDDKGLATATILELFNYYE